MELAVLYPLRIDQFDDGLTFQAEVFVGLERTL